MHKPNPSPGDLPQLAAALLERLRTQRPARALHHQCRGAEFHRQCAARRRLPAVDDDFARGDRASSSPAPMRCWSISARSIASAARRSKSRCRPRRRSKLPWVLDPVLIDRAPLRAGFARTLIDSAPNVVRLNGAEFAALAGCEGSREALAKFAGGRKLVVALSGETDLVSDGRRTATIANGHPLMAKVTAMGCAGSALIAACLAVEADAWRAAAAGLVLLRHCRRSGGKGSQRAGQFRGGHHRCARRA